MSKGVEWALHSCLEMAWASPDPVTASRLAELHDLPTAYLNKQLQQLARAGVVSSTPGRGGGFVLSREPADLSLLEIVEAIEGEQGGFRCAEIRQRGPLAAPPEACRTPCELASVMYRAEAAWRAVLAKTRLADIVTELGLRHPEAKRALQEWLG
jgi:Rrf2 family protein